MKIGFDNEKYLKIQSEHIKERISQFDGKLYLAENQAIRDLHDGHRKAFLLIPDRAFRQTVRFYP